MKKLKWNRNSLDAYELGGREMRQRGYRAIRDLEDADCRSILTFWFAPDGSSIIQQTFFDTADVIWWKGMTTAEFERDPNGGVSSDLCAASTFEEL